MNEQQIIEQVEAVTDAATEAVVPEIVESIEVVRNNPYILVGVALVAASTGVAIGYKVAEKRLTTKFNEHLETQLDKTKEHYERRIEDLEGSVHVEQPEPFVHPEQPDPEETRLINKYGGVKVKETETDVVVETKTVGEDAEGDEVETTKTVEKRNIFVNGKPLNEDDFDYDEEMKQRSADTPYVITEDEFMENDEDFTQVQLTYYAGDDVLADAEEHTMDAVDKLVGNMNLSRFGHGSKDKNLVYVRNEAQKVDYEIAKSEGKYAVEVLGFDDSEVAQPRRFRGDDD